MIEIELTENVAKELINSKQDDIDVNYLPYDKFITLFPFNVIVDKELAMKENNIGEENSDKLDKIFNSETKLMVDFSNEMYYYKLTNKTTGSVLEFVYSRVFPIPIIKESNLQPSDMEIARKLVKLSFMLVHHLSKPNAIEHRKMVKIKRNNAEKKRIKHNSKKSYIYKTRYVYDNLDDVRGKRDYHIIQSSWQVSGHWRIYKNGKKVWVNPYLKGKKNKDNVSRKKITRL